MYNPQNAKNSPIVYRVYEACRNADGSTSGPDGLGGSRDFITNVGIKSVTSWINATTRTVQPNPI